MKIRKWHLIGGTFFIIISSACYYWLNISRKTVLNTSQINVAHLDLNEVLKKHPDWSNYQKIQNELGQLRQKWNKQTDSLINTREFSSDSLINAEINNQIMSIQAMFEEEVSTKLENINKLLAEYSENRRSQMNADLNSKINSVNERLKNLIQKKVDESEKSLVEYQKKVQAEYQLQLTNLQFQFSMAEMSLNKEEALLQKKKIQVEIERIRHEIDEKVNIEAEKIRKSLDEFSDDQKKKTSLEIEEYKANLERNFEKDFIAYRQKLESEFEDWRKHREADLKSAIEVRKDQSKTEFIQDNVKMQVLQSQLSQLKDQMIWDIRQKTKFLARLKKIDLIIDGGINLCLIDLRPELEKMIAHN